MSRILVVDDSVTIRKVVGAILQRNGYEVVAAADGQAALDALTGSGEAEAREAVDLVLLDFVMPRMNGYQFCRAIRQDDALSALPIVLMSAKSDKIRDQFVQQTGAIDAISKPFDAQALVAAIENALRRVQTGRASAARLPEIAEDEPPPDSDKATSPGEERMKRARIAAEVAVGLARTIAPGMTKLRPDARAQADEVLNVLTSSLDADALRDFAITIRDLDLDDGPRAALAGDLAVIPIGAALQLLQVEGQSGQLTVSQKHSDSEILVTLRGGLIDLVQSRGTNDEFRLGRYFVEEGLVTPAEIERLLVKDAPANDASPPTSGQFEVGPGAPASGGNAPLTVGPDTDEGPYPASGDPGASPADKEPTTMRLDPKETEALVKEAERKQAEGGATTTPDGIPAVAPLLLGDRLLAAGRVNQEQLKSALVRQSCELVYEMLRWPKGKFEFKRRPPTPLAAAARLGLTVPAVVMEGFRRVDEWRGLERTLGSFDTVLARDELALSQLPQDKLAKPERAILDAIDGERTIREVVTASHMSSFDACRVLAQLLEARVVRRRA